MLRGLGQYLGRPVSQTPDGRTLCHIRDTGAAPDTAAAPDAPAPPAYRTRAAIPFHTAESDLLALLCLRPARSGGRTLLASAAAVHNAVLSARPDLAGNLYRQHHFDGQPERTSGEETSLASPLITRHGDRPSMRYDRARLARGPHGSEPTSAPDVDSRLYTLIDSTAASPVVRLDLDLRPGDLLLLDNHVVLHARSAYDDFDAPQAKRHLLRLWLARPDDTAPGDPRAEPPARPLTRTGVTPRDIVRPRGPGVTGPGWDCPPPRALRGEATTPLS